MEGMAHADPLAQESGRHLSLDAHAIAIEHLALGETIDARGYDAVACIPDAEAAEWHLAGHFPFVVEGDGEPSVPDVRDHAFAVGLPLVIDGQALQGETGGSCDGDGLHPAVAFERGAPGPYRDVRAAGEVQSLDVGEVGGEHLFLRVAAVRSGEDVLLELPGGGIRDPVDAGRHFQGGAGMPAAVLRGFSQGAGVILAVVGACAEACDGDRGPCLCGQGGETDDGKKADGCGETQAWQVFHIAKITFPLDFFK